MRAWAGSLVLGQNQECYGSCFSPSQALTGDIAALRIWSRALPQVWYWLSAIFLPRLAANRCLCDSWLPGLSISIIEGLQSIEGQRLGVLGLDCAADCHRIASGDANCTPPRVPCM